jgi:hypothetical protein
LKSCIWYKYNHSRDYRKVAESSASSAGLVSCDVLTILKRSWINFLAFQVVGL